MVWLDPPGTLLQNRAVIELVDRASARTFCEVGVGAGRLSRALCDRGLRGAGIEFSAAALEQARTTLAGADYQLIAENFMTMEPLPEEFDLALSMMVMEHVEDDVGFAARMKNLVRPGGTVLIGVPARMDRWGIEDEAAGHLRRYDRPGLARVLRKAGLMEIEVRSVSVPAANLTFHASNFLIRRAGATAKPSLTQRQKTETSGLREVPFKTVFPSAFKAVLNPVTLFPLFLLQRAFYDTDLGLTLVASAKRPPLTPP